MVRHIVMWRLKDENKSENLKIMKEMLLSLKDKIPNVAYLEIGTNFNADSSSFDMVLIATFESNEDLMIYQNHPEHVKVAKFIQDVRKERAVVDYDI